MHSFAPNHEGPRVSHQICGAFVVTPTTLKSLVEAGERFLKEEGAIQRFVAIRFGHEPLVIESFDDVLTLRNPQSAPIRGLLIALNTADRGLHILLATEGSDCAAIRLDAIGDSADDLSALAANVRLEAKNSAAWYSPVRWLYDSAFALLIKIPGRVLLITGTLLVVLWIAWVAFGTIHRVNLHQWREGASSAVDATRRGEARGLVLDGDAAARVERVETALAATSTTSWGSWVAVIAGSLVVGLIMPKAIDALFPRVEFAIGDGAHRRARTAAARHFVLVTVATSGLAIPLIRSCALGG